MDHFGSTFRFGAIYFSVKIYKPKTTSAQFKNQFRLEVLMT